MNAMQALSPAQLKCRPALAVAILLVAAAYGLFGQSDTHPAFAVASIKRNTSNWSEPTQHPMGVGYRPGGRLTATNASLRLLIQFAYAAHDSPHSLPLLAFKELLPRAFEFS